MSIIRGDLIQLAKRGKFDVIIHGCNCFCTMGAGIAKTIKETFPDAYEADLKTKKGDKNKLGGYSFAEVNPDSYKFTIVNAYTQYDYRFSKDVINASYDAMREVFKKIKIDFTGKRIGYPAIGAGLAGGDWAIIYKIICEELRGEDHTFVIYDKGVR